jgi:glycosyltransferase involved in cell wall biosynthesis
MNTMNTVSLLYGVEYTLLDPLPETLIQDEPLLIGLKLRNTGLTPWLVSGYPVLVVIRWFDRQGNMVIELPWRALPHPVPANESTTIELRIDQTPPPGEYVLTIELVEHQVAWFRDKGVQPFSHLIRIKPPQGPRITVINGNCVANDAVGKHVAAQIRALAEAGFRPLLLTEFIDDRIPRSLRRFMVTVNLDDILRPNAQTRRFAEHFYGSTVIIVNYSTYYNLVELIRYAQTPVLFDYHGITPPEIWGVGQPGYEELVRGVSNLSNLLKFADYAVAHSRFTANELIATGATACSRIMIIPYAVVDKVAYADLPDLNLLQQYDLSGKYVLLYVGRMARNKSVHVLVESLPLIRTQYPNTVLLLVGDTSHVYASYVAEIKARAKELGVAEAVIFAGRQERDIRDFYQLCDIFVTASIHEGFCMPVIEAMANGKPVVATDATALPDTVGNAGLLFQPNDPVDLAHQVMCMLAAKAQTLHSTLDLQKFEQQMLFQRPIAFVTPRYGHDIIGGAEQGARKWAEQLAANGFNVEVLTTNMVDIVQWQTASLPEVEVIHGVTVRRFPVDLVDPVGFHEVQIKAALGAKISRHDEEHFMAHNLRSRALEDYIACHCEDYAAFIFTPYLFGTSYYGAQQARDRAFHIPCLHDEPAARFSIFREMLEEARGIFFNTAAEEQLAREKLHIANPFTAVLGFGFPDQPPRGDANRFRKRTGITAPFLLYSGRLETAKNVPLLIEWFLAYKQARPQSNLMLVLTGKGAINLPTRPDILSLGVIDWKDLTDAYAASAALCQLSLNESFSIVMMEAWQQHRPVIVHADCAVTRDHVERSGGGYACRDVTSFITAIDTLLEYPEEATILGERGYTYVQKHFTWSILVDKFVRTLSTFLQPRSMIATFAQRGIRRALDFTYDRFEAHFISLVQRMCEQDGDWQLLEEVRSKLSALRHNHAPISDYNDDLSKPAGRSVRTWLKGRSQSETKVSPSVNKQTNDVTVQLLTELFELLIQTRNNQRRLEREQARLIDRILE